MPAPLHPRDVDAYPPALETAEAWLVTERRRAVLHPAQADEQETAGTVVVDQSLFARIRAYVRRVVKAFSRRRPLAVAPEAAPAPPPAPQRLPDDAIGVGLSGGGVRSATFCLGTFQALAEQRLIGAIDFLSTVSGGGYFGAFFGRLFTRPWIGNVEDVERVLNGLDPVGAPPARTGWGPRVFRWMRDNSRYLAPRGSGDILVLGAILLRNWLAVQLVLVTTVLAGFVALQLIRVQLEARLGMTAGGSSIAQLLGCDLPGATMLWWSPWILVALLPFLGVAVPAGWAYWMVVRLRDGRRGLPPWLGLVAVCLAAIAGSVYYRHVDDLTWITSWMPDWLTSWMPVAAGTHRVRLVVCALVAVTGLLTLVAWLVGEASVVGLGSGNDTGNLLRSRLSRWLKTGLVCTGAILAWALIDSMSGAIYALSFESRRSLIQWATGIFTGFAGVGAFARQLTLLLAPNKGSERPRISMSIVMWVAAVLAGTLWLVTIAVGSHAIAWDLKVPRDAPLAMAAASECVAPAITRYPTHFAPIAFALLTAFTFLFGRTRTFANMSSIHAFYAARLTRTYLGASNRARLVTDIPVTDTTRGDDYAGEAYWDWPHVGENSDAEPTVARPYRKGGPLHIVNATINETVDARTGVQNQDRKGTILAIGPSGLSVGVRHHLVTTAQGAVALPADDDTRHRVFRTDGRATTPDPLSLGKWISVSGAAFSPAAGANTTVPIAILAGLFNVRLGYWWDSGTATRGWVLERWLPVQAALFAEMFAQTRGTSGALWNLSDGGHFENMGGYELIRRRLPIIVIIDAEADPDYTFEGVSDLVRKARLDFNAEITFLTEAELSSTRVVNGLAVPAVPAALRPMFGDLDALRRGKWSDESMPFPATAEDKRFSLEVDRARLSQAHASLARVEYQDDGERRASWLVYVKATLTGEEPEDVSQYHRAHPEFPQETTSDQFFDERQWESYRRLGLHVGRRVLTPELFAHLRAHPAQ